MNKTRLKAFQQMPIFGGLTEESILFLLNLCPMVKVPAGEFYFHELQKGGSMYVLEKGKVAVIKPLEDMGHLMAYLDRGDCFGEMELIDPQARAASVMAVADSFAIQISSASLLSLYKHDLEQFTLIQMNMCREISRRLRRMDEECFTARKESPRSEPFYLTWEEIRKQGISGSHSQNERSTQ